MKRLAASAALLLATATHAEGAAALYQARCKMCHGPDGKGTSVGKMMGAPDLTTSKITAAGAAVVIENGRNKMAGFKGKLPDADIKALASYVAGLRK